MRCTASPWNRLLGTRVEISAAALPAGAAPEPSSTGAIRCGDRIVRADLGFIMPAVAGRSGPVAASRALAPYPALATDIPAEFWQATRIGGFAAAVAAPVTGGRSRVEIVVWDPDGVQTYVNADFVPASPVVAFAEELVAAQNGGAQPDLSHSGSTRSGVPLVDRVIDAVLTGDPAALTSLVELTTVACGVSVESAPKPRCPFGADVGTPVEVLPLANCETFFIPAESAADALRLLVDATPRLFAVGRFDSSGSFLNSPSSRYGIVFVGDGIIARGVLVGVGEAGITSISYGCGATSPSAFSNELSGGLVVPAPNSP